MASAANQRETVTGLIDWTSLWPTASFAISREENLASGRHLTDGGVQARALTPATCTLLNTGGRPERFLSFRAGIRPK